MAGCTREAMSSTLNNNATILVVDDDELILSSLRGLFTLETEYELLSFSDPKEAVKELGRRPIDVVISDFLMPEVNGVELLRRARELQPETARILLTGFADKENAIRAINEAGLYQYIEKPWDNEDLLLHDTGRGLPEEQAAKLFDLEFTTKGSRVGVGLGLANVYNVIKKHHGEISVSSEVGQGTEFLVTLPVIQVQGAAG